MILLTGGAGYIGSHTCIELIESNYDIVVFDNLSNATLASLERVTLLTGKAIPFLKGDIRSISDLRSVFDKYPISSVIHFAGLKAVGESVINPIRYYENNFSGTINLCKVMEEKNCVNLVFSSSATVYGDPFNTPITEDSELSPTNPYGYTKLMIEQFLKSLEVSSKDWKFGILRYFNPVGAHSSYLIGEDPHGIPNNLMPFISQVAIGRREKLKIFGGDYQTPDGTGVRDYIHVVDLAKGHVKALQALEKGKSFTVNLGTGKGYSVLDVVEAFERASGNNIPYEIGARRPGDIAKCYADPSLSYELLGWRAELDLQKMCQDSWGWQCQNPNGYE